ncbi:Hsp70-like protein [Phytophthora palmivora]|uniref:Hsp70-like protein n=1 Tax=Phytophthora palmivora TaxID=4796 RepID=A0A2P4XNS1_9STRA|nr:Hsp70-like protein [Phytophthora palmivora]
MPDGYPGNYFFEIDKGVLSIRHLKLPRPMLAPRVASWIINNNQILYPEGVGRQAQCCTPRRPPLDERPAVPTDTAASVGLNLEGLVFLMLPKELWILIAEESNGYQRWQRNFSPGKLAEWNQRRRDRKPLHKPKSPAQRERDMAKFKEIQPHELVNFIGLFCARALCPHRGRHSRHWATNAQGAVPRGTFIKFMSRHRFEEII